MSDAHVSPERSTRRLLLATVLGLFTFLAVLEVLLHLVPEQLPVWYLTKFPGGGIEFKHPGFLSSLPIEGSPPRWFARDYTGRPPGDLSKKWPLADPAKNPDPRRYPPFHWRLDEDFLSNPKKLDKADVLLLGDSIGCAASILSPPALQVRLAQQTRLSVYNISEPGAGALQQEWMLDRYGLSREPKAVIWMFFDGNDFLDANILSIGRAAGYRTWADVPPHRQPPTLYLPSMLGYWGKQFWSSTGATSYLPGLHFSLADGEPLPIWFNPSYLIAMSRSREWWQALPGYSATLDAMRRSHRKALDAGARFLVLFVPCKSHVLISHVEPDPSAIYAMATHFGHEPGEQDPERFFEALMSNRGVQEDLVRSFCESEGIDFLSAVPYLDALAERGEPGYFSADTHWSPTGQAALLEPLEEWLFAESE